METTIKVLCTEQEAFALRDLLPTDEFIKMVNNDPEWGFAGSGELYVVYINNQYNYYSASRLFSLGIDLAKKIANK